MHILFTLFSLGLLLGFVVLIFLLIVFLIRKIFGKIGFLDNFYENKIKSFKLEDYKLIVKFLVALVIVVFLSIPNDLIFKKVVERNNYNKSVKAELAAVWGGKQVFTGPIIVVKQSQIIKEKIMKEFIVPIEGTDKTKKEEREIEVERTIIKDKVYLPEELKIIVNLEPEQRKRGIYSTNVYTADLKVSGNFQFPNEKLPPRTVVHWDEVKVIIGLTDTKAFKSASIFNINNNKYKFFSGTDNLSLLPKGFSTTVNFANVGNNKKVDFDFNIKVAGSGSISLAPVGMKNDFLVESTWNSPKFYNGLPDSHNIKADGFTAKWEITSLVRNYPQIAYLANFESLAKYQAGSSTKYNYDEYSHGYEEEADSFSSPFNEYLASVELFDSIDNYALLFKALKYALLFVALTFLGVIVYEIAIDKKSNAKLHIIQYAIIGIALIVFYLVLLAFAEHFIFIYAYLIAASINIFMVSLYISIALKSAKNGLSVFIILFMLYLSLFFILQMEDYGLLSGTILLVIGIAALMYVTRNISTKKNINNKIVEEINE